MNQATLEELREALGDRLVQAGCHAPLAAASAGRVAIDSRQIRPGDVFWALPGSQHDGADFCNEAFARGAAGVVSQRSVSPPGSRWSLQVDNSLAALGDWARWHRRRFTGQVVAVTGSAGKTTTRLMIDTVLRSQFSGTASPRNFNNQLGVSLSLLRVEPSHDYAALELGASAPGEIATLAALCQPQVGVITGIGDAHLGGFGSRDALGRCKAELLDALPGDGWAVLNGDDVWLRKHASCRGSRIVWVGRGAECDVSATQVRSRSGQLSLTVDGTRLHVPVWGRHHLSGVLAAVAVGRIFEIPLEEIAHALSRFQAPTMRCEVTRVRGATIINDAYNSSPVAMRAALELLRETSAAGRRIVVCGDMRELGPSSADLHRRLGDEVVTVCGADLLLACGRYADEVVVGARRAGMPPVQAVVCREPEEAATQLDQQLAAGDVVLVKGSRALAMERIVQQLETACCRWAA